jgi:hypothetical protein
MSTHVRSVKPQRFVNDGIGLQIGKRRCVDHGQEALQESPGLCCLVQAKMLGDLMKKYGSESEKEE